MYLKSSIQTSSINYMDMNYFNLPNYTLVYDDYRLSSHGRLMTYIHNSFDFRRLDILEYNQISTVYESMIIEI